MNIFLKRFPGYANDRETNAGAGTYTLNITDAGNCQVQSKPLTLTNTNVALELPWYDEVVIFRNANTDLRVKNYSPGEYRLYSNANGTQLLQKNDHGNFVVSHIANDTSFYVRKVTGSCESPLAKINIKVVDRYFYIPNAFSPNADGLNDVFKVVYPFPVSAFRLSISNRFGQKVFETFDIKKGWDGTFRSELQPAGVYAWTIQFTEIGKEAHT